MPTDEVKQQKYDPIAVANLLKVASAYGAHPLGEIVGQFADQLKAAQAVIIDAESRARSAQTAGDRAIADLETAQATIRSMRSGTSGLQGLIDALTAISLNPRGASKVAKDALTTFNAAKGEKV
jgi:hypothetical protein